MYGGFCCSSSSGLVALDVNAVQKILERAVVDLDDSLPLSLSHLRHAEQPAIETFVEQAKSGPVEEQDLHRLAALAEEHEQRAATRVAADALGDDAAQSIESPP